MTRPFAPLLLALAAVGACALAAQVAARAQDEAIPAPEETFEEWLADFRDRAMETHPREVVDEVLDDLEPLERVIELDQTQPEFEQTIWSYLDSAASASRIATGRERSAEASELLATLERTYEIDAPYVAAIWGIESAFGANIGDFDAASSLATLAWEGRRREQFESELLAMMDIIRSGAAERSDFVSGWAGALGQTQFMPSTYIAYAVDQDGDGRKDIWKNRADALASASNYISTNGWRKGEPWGVEVTLPDGFDLAMADGRRKSAGAWAVDGVLRADGAPWSADEQFLQARLLLPAGADGPAFLTFSNYDVFRRYNNATSYALAAGILGDAIAGKPGLKAEWPRHERALSRDEISELQRLLNQLGYDTQGIDGRVGPNTRAALRLFQADRSMPTDAFATAALLDRARADAASE